MAVYTYNEGYTLIDCNGCPFLGIHLNIIVSVDRTSIALADLDTIVVVHRSIETADSPPPAWPGYVLFEE